MRFHGHSIQSGGKKTKTTRRMITNSPILESNGMN
ncbi:protein of unknown function [Streptomyces sp. KY75]|nr:protein of unknown function [Streptomyces sp. KY75]CAD5993308.1 protein of unknown function [Streptomyces sp. KY70]